jgi:hypothetical protein
MGAFRWACMVAALIAPGCVAQSDRGGETFEFQSGFWTNLHHFVYEQAMSQTPVEADSAGWRAALGYYKREVLPQSGSAARYLLTREMETINNTLSDRQKGDSLKGSGLKPELIAALESAAPVYRERWWPEHNRSNLEWIAAARPLVEKYAGVLRSELASVYRARWPDGPIRTDVTQYAGLGAYTTLGPVHITASGVDPANSGAAALEILFHEASHALIGGVRESLAREAQAQGRVLRRDDLWHALLFYTTGEIVRRHLDGYTPGKLYDRAWPGALSVFEQDWQPYLEGKSDYQTAVRQVVAGYSLEKER